MSRGRGTCGGVYTSRACGEVGHVEGVERVKGWGVWRGCGNLVCRAADV